MSTQQMDALRSTTAPIYDQLKAAIVSGDLQPGEPLRQDEIARLHGVSKIPVREALLRLQVDGFVVFRKNRGASVRGLSSNEVLHLLDIRVALECKALELSIPRMAQSDIEAAARILEKWPNEADSLAWSDMNLRFHRTLYEPCENGQLLQMISDLQQRMGPFARLVVTQVSGIKRPHEEHQAILDACANGEVDHAVALLRDHIGTTKKETAAQLRRHKAEGEPQTARRAT